MRIRLIDGSVEIESDQFRLVKVDGHPGSQWRTLDIPACEAIRRITDEAEYVLDAIEMLSGGSE